MLKRGRKAAKWDRTRAKLKLIFERNGVTRCEVCNSGFNLSFAHRLKRRFITDETELMFVALLCFDHHNAIEYAGHEQMYDAVTRIREQNPLTNWP